MNLISIIYILVFAYLLKILVDLLRGEAIYVPLPKSTIRKMLRLAKVNKNDIVYDLGSGDGKVLRIATKEFKVKKAVGIEKSLILVLISKFLNKIYRLENKIEIRWGDFLKENISDATVIILYLNFGIMKKLEKKIIKECKNVRIVSAAHKFPNLKYKKRFKTGHFYSYLYEL